MAKSQKAKSGQVRNDARKNGKAAKKRPGSRGSRGTRLDEGTKVLLGGGMFRKWDDFNKAEAIVMRAKDRRKNKTSDDA